SKGNHTAISVPTMGSTDVGQLVHVLAAVAVPEQDRHGSAGVLEEIVGGQLADLGGGRPFLVPDVHRSGMTVQVDALGIDHDQLGAPLADRLLDAQVDDRDVV